MSRNYIQRENPAPQQNWNYQAKDKATQERIRQWSTKPREMIVDAELVPSDGTGRRKSKLNKGLAIFAGLICAGAGISVGMYYYYNSAQNHNPNHYDNQNSTAPSHTPTAQNNNTPIQPIVEPPIQPPIYNNTPINQTPINNTPYTNTTPEINITPELPPINNTNISKPEVHNNETNQSKPLDDLIGYWNFDEENGDVAKDMSNYSNSAKLIDAKFGEGHKDRGLILNGVGYANIPHIGTYTNLSAITLSIWVKATNLTDANYRGIIQKGSYSPPGWILMTGEKDWADNAIFFGWYNNTWNNTQDHVKIPSNEWAHYIVTYDGNFTKIYRNNALMSVFGAKGLNLNNEQPIQIGARYPSALSKGWEGAIDEVKIWKKALNLDEILKES